MTTDHDHLDAHPPIPAPPYLPNAQVWQGPFGAWLLYDAASSTGGSLRTASDGHIWSLIHPVAEDVFGRSLQGANEIVHAALREHAKASKSH